MALSKEELKLVESMKASGMSTPEITRQIAKRRSGSAAIDFTSNSPQREQFKSGFLATLKDIPSDIKESFSGAVDSVSTGIESAEEARKQVETEEISPLAGTAKTIGGGLKAGAGVVGQALLGLGKLFTSPAKEQQIKEGVQTAALEVAQSEPVKKLIERYDALSPEKKAVVDGFLGTTEGLTTMFGAGPVTKILKQGVAITADAARSVIPNVTNLTREMTENAIKTVNSISELPSKAKSWVQQPLKANVENVLKETPVQQFDKFVDIEKKAIENNKNQTPLEFAGVRAQEALDQIQRKLNTIGENKSAIIESSTGRKPVGSIVVKFRQDLQRAIQDRPEVEGNKKVYRDILAEAARLGDNPSAQQVDKFIDFVQDRVYTGKRDLTIPVTDDVEQVLRPITGRLNESLKSQLPSGYRTLNEQYSTLVAVKNELNLKLGLEGEKGGALMKRVFSPSDARTKQLFADVLDITGIDLVNEATLARFMMDIFGDARQKSMLEQLNISATTPTPTGIVNRVIDYFIEKANTPEETLRRARDITIGGGSSAPR